MDFIENKKFQVFFQSFVMKITALSVIYPFHNKYQYNLTKNLKLKTVYRWIDSEHYYHVPVIRINLLECNFFDSIYETEKFKGK